MYIRTGMKFIFSIAALLLYLNNGAQTLTLYGKIDDADRNVKGRLYYSLNGERFSLKQSVPYTNFGEYSFTIKISLLKEKKVRDIIFSTDTTNDPFRFESCVHRVHADAILDHPDFANSRSIRVHTDLLTTYFCSTSVLYTAGRDGNDRFTGSYKLQFKDTTLNLKLYDELYNASADLFPANSELMDHLNGGWSYNSDQKTLSIYLNYQWNQRLGIALSKPWNLNFRVEEQNGQLSFKSDEYSLIKN